MIVTEFSLLENDIQKQMVWNTSLRKTDRYRNDAQKQVVWNTSLRKVDRYNSKARVRHLELVIARVMREQGTAIAA